MANRKSRPANPGVLGDLLPGDRCVIDTDRGPIMIRVSWHAGTHTYARVDAGKTQEVERYLSDSKILELGWLMPQSKRGNRKTAGTVNDPLREGKQGK